MTKIAFITGINGQDGSYLVELLLKKNYDIWGIIRRCSNINTDRINHILNKINLSYGDVTDTHCLINILNKIQKSYKNISVIEIYNLAAMSHVKVSFDIPEYTGINSGISVLNLLESVRLSDLDITKVKFYQASTSELYGLVQEVPQNENTPFYPRSPYGVAKLYGYWIVKNYRESYNMFACNGILFNHESPRRGQTFVTRKITKGLWKILNNIEDCLILGNLDAKRDWGHAEDYVEGMWRILQNDKPIDYVISTNEEHTVREFVEQSFKLRNIDIKWEGSGINEVGIDSESGKVLIKVSEKYFRPAEVDRLIGDSSKIRKELGWKPKKNFKDLVKDMVDADCPL